MEQIPAKKKLLKTAAMEYSYVERGLSELDFDENDTSCNLLFLPVDHTQPTGVEALAIVLGHEDDVLPHLRLLKIEHYFLHERMKNQRLQENLINLQAGTGRRMREFEEDGARLSFLTEQMEQEFEQSTNEGKISMLRNMNSALRKTIRGVDRVQSDMKLCNTKSISSSTFKTQVKLYSLDTYSEATQKSIPSPLPKMENMFLHEKAKGCILTVQLSWLNDVVDEYLVF